MEKITGDRPHRASLFRWRQRGLAGVKLKTTYAVGAHRTTEAWLREFFDSVAAAKNGEPAATVREVPSVAQRRAQADQELADAGI
ncbi:DUF1580 domain-containing protein [Rosistilla oblonga]|uniref:DUF1580 domain-containing protein n=1 Tax=Rosistilla oblonga TaxID=2527990 RepID=UPI003A96CB17